MVWPWVKFNCVGCLNRNFYRPTWIYILRQIWELLKLVQKHHLNIFINFFSFYPRCILYKYKHIHNYIYSHCWELQKLVKKLNLRIFVQISFIVRISKHIIICSNLIISHIVYLFKSHDRFVWFNTTGYNKKRIQTHY